MRGTLLIGQQEPCLRVPVPGSKEYKDLEEKRFQTWVYRELRACDVKLSKKGEAGQPYVESKTLTKAFPFTGQSVLKLRMQACQCKQEGSRWVLKEDVRIPTEQELRKEVRDGVASVAFVFLCLVSIGIHRGLCSFRL